MRERVEGAGGSLQIESEPGDGTVICASVPLASVPVSGTPLSSAPVSAAPVNDAR